MNTDNGTDNRRVAQDVRALTVVVTAVSTDGSLCDLKKVEGLRAPFDDNSASRRTEGPMPRAPGLQPSRYHALLSRQPRDSKLVQEGRCLRTCARPWFSRVGRLLLLRDSRGRFARLRVPLPQRPALRRRRRPFGPSRRCSAGPALTHRRSRRGAGGMLRRWWCAIASGARWSARAVPDTCSRTSWPRMRTLHVFPS